MFVDFDNEVFCRGLPILDEALRLFQVGRALGKQLLVQFRERDIRTVLRDRKCAATVGNGALSGHGTTPRYNRADEARLRTL